MRGPRGSPCVLRRRQQLIALLPPFFLFPPCFEAFFPAKGAKAGGFGWSRLDARDALDGFDVSPAASLISIIFSTGKVYERWCAKAFTAVSHGLPFWTFVCFLPPLAYDITTPPHPRASLPGG